MRKTTVLAITCSFFDHFGSSWACFSSENRPCCVAVQQPVWLLNLKASNCNCSCSCYQLGLGWVAVFLQLLQLDLTRLVEKDAHLIHIPKHKTKPPNFMPLGGYARERSEALAGVHSMMTRTNEATGLTHQVQLD